MRLRKLMSILLTIVIVCTTFPINAAAAVNKCPYALFQNGTLWFFYVDKGEAPDDWYPLDELGETYFKFQLPWTSFTEEIRSIVAVNTA